jgi:hypothetical protein
VRNRKHSTTWTTWKRRKLRGLPSIAGLALLTAAAWRVDTTLGIAAAGLSCVAVDAMAEEEDKQR